MADEAFACTELFVLLGDSWLLGLAKPPLHWKMPRPTTQITARAAIILAPAFKRFCRALFVPFAVRLGWRWCVVVLGFLDSCACGRSLRCELAFGRTEELRRVFERVRGDESCCRLLSVRRLVLTRELACVVELVASCALVCVFRLALVRGTEVLRDRLLVRRPLPVLASWRDCASRWDRWACVRAAWRRESPDSASCARSISGNLRSRALVRSWRLLFEVVLNWFLRNLYSQSGAARPKIVADAF